MLNLNPEQRILFLVFTHYSITQYCPESFTQYFPEFSKKKKQSHFTQVGLDSQ